MIRNLTEFESASVEMLNETNSEGNQCARFKSHPKERGDKRMLLFFNVVI